MNARLGSLFLVGLGIAVLVTVNACTSELQDSLRASARATVEPDAGESNSCAAGNWERSGDSGTSCILWTQCGTGQFVQSEGTLDRDRVCAPCPAETFSTSLNQDQCRAWTECGQGQYEVQPGSATRDRLCAACPDAASDGGGCEREDDCEPGTELTQNPVSAGAVACSPCEPGEYCPGGVRDAISCSGMGWDHDADPATPCEAYSECPAGEYVSLDGTARDDRVCTACEDGTFSESVNAALCAPMRSCEPGTFVSVPGTNESDVVCEGCPGGSFSTLQNAESCTSWTNCVPGEFVSEVGSPVSDRLCEQCAAQTYSDGINAGACVAVGECAPGSVRVLAVDAGSGPADCLPCEPGQFCAGADVEAVACAEGSWDDDADPATPCSAMTPCALGQYVATAGDALNDRVCAGCAEGEFSDVANASQCEPLQNCAAGTYAAQPGSSTNDRSCQACEPGSFSTLENAPACTTWSTCAAPSEYVSNTPDEVTDRQCGDCEAPQETLTDNANACVLATFQMNDGSVSFEAEHFHLQELYESQHSWQLLASDSASGDECMLVGPEVAYQWTGPVGYAPELRFRVEFTSTGTFYVNLRGITGSAGGGADSCFAAIDNRLSGTYDFDDQAGAQGWRQMSLSVDTVGVHTVSIWPSEDGFCVDKVVVSSAATLPVDEGPAESPEQ